MDVETKRALLLRAVTRLEGEVAALRASAEETRRAATHEESRAENDKDTRGLEASYLARGQAMRVEETEEAITRLRFLAPRAFTEEMPIGLTALVILEDEEGVARSYLLVPVSGGVCLSYEDDEIWLITPASPIGRALVDKRVGDVVGVRRRGKLEELEIVRVA
ncbi:MAG: GreA/GreB family elongation factor [Sandaracinaceae bacterium]